MAEGKAKSGLDDTFLQESNDLTCKVINLLALTQYRKGLASRSVNKLSIPRWQYSHHYVFYEYFVIYWLEAEFSNGPYRHCFRYQNLRTLFFEPPQRLFSQIINQCNHQRKSGRISLHWTGIDQI